MSTVRLSLRDDPVVFYAVDLDGAAVGEVQHHARHAAILRIGAQAWWLADDVATAHEAAGASIARRVLSHLTTPACYSLRADGGTAVLARARRRMRWSSRDNGIDCEVAGVPYRIRVESVFGGSFALQDGAGIKLGDIRVGSFGRVVHATGSPLPLPETAFLLYATHRMYGQDPGGTVATGSE